MGATTSCVPRQHGRMKLSVSLTVEDVEFLDAYASERGFASRSAVLHEAVRLLRGAELGAAYEYAFAQWEEEGDAAAWDVPVSYGLSTDASEQRC